MAEWTDVLLRVYSPVNALIHSTDQLIEAQGSAAWHEIGRGASVTVPFTDTDDFDIYARGNRVYVTVINGGVLTTHVVCDFIIESCDVDEVQLEGGAIAAQLKVNGRDLLKELAEIPCGLRHISKYRPSAGAATAVDKTTLQMNATDTATWAATSLVGWTVELADGNWSEIVAHTAGGLLSIDPAWQVNTEDETADPPPAQTFKLYGGAFTETTGTYTDLKLALLNVPAATNWALRSPGYTSTEEGTFVAPGNEASVLKALQLIAAQSGEYFVRESSMRRIQWRREIPPITHPQYGYELMLSVPLAPLYNNAQNATILPGAKLRRDATETVTRVKPVGAGNGDEALSLRSLPDGFAVESGYSVDGEYLVYNAAETGGRRIAKDLRLDNIGPASDSSLSRQLAVTALYQAALLWLKEHNAERLVLDCDVLSPIPIEPVTYVRVNLAEYDLNNVVMYVLESTAVLKEGRVIYKVQLSDKKAAVLTDERIMAEAIRSTDRYIFYVNAPARNSRRIDKGGEGTGGESDHDPVTAGNAAIGVATGQVVSLVLAGPSGLEIASTGLRLADTVAGDGLTISNKVVSLNLSANGGLVLAGDLLALGTPGSVTATSGNTLTGGSHTHAVTATSDGKVTPGALLKSTAFGDLTLRVLAADRVTTAEVETLAGGLTLDPASGVVYSDGNLSFVGARQIVTDTGSLTLAPAQTLVIDPADDVAQINSAVTLKTAHWASGFLGTGWGVTYSGELDARKIYADELHVAAFIADTARVKVGSEYVTPSMALVSRNFTIPVVGASATLYVEDAPGLAGLPVFADGDWVLLRIVNRSAGLLVANVWGQVSSYADLSDGEQSWTFICRNTSAAGQVARRGTTALDFGLSGDGWWWVTTLDPAGSPYAGITTWQGSDPYTEGNRTHRLRLGQLKGVTGVNEWGLQAGTATASFVRFTDLRSEIHGSRLSLYAGDNAELRVCAVNVLFYTDTVTFQTLTPNADHNSLNVVSTGATFYQAIDEGTGTPNLTDYIRNSANTAGYVTVGLSNPTFGAIYKIRLAWVLAASGFSNDTVRLYAQVFKSDEITPLTGEILIQTRTTNASSISSGMDFTFHDDAPTATDWNNARLRLRWEYDINVNEEAIRLDPAVPSLAVGNALPTGPDAGGDGLWVGAESGIYKLRLGEASGVGLRWDGTTLAIRNSSNTNVIELDASGNSRFAGVMTIGTAGEIRQGTGTLGSDFDGLRLFNSSGKGHLAFYGTGNLSAYTNGNGLIGYIHGYDGGGGLTSALEIGIQATHASQNRGVSLAAATGGSFSGVTAISGSIDQVGLYTSSSLRLKADDDGVDVTGLLTASGDVRTGGGLAVGDNSLDPLTGVLLMKERTAATSSTPADSAQIWVQDVAGVQKLYIKFANGTQRELATA